MKITEISPFVCNAYRTNWVFVKVMTDSEIYGIGEATLEFFELSVAKAIEEIGVSLIGKDPHAVEAFFHYSFRDSYWQGGAVIMSALSAIEMAMWDIKGKDLGVPVYQLLGGKLRDRIPCYANAWFTSARTPEQFAAKAKEALKMGFIGLKWDPFGSAWQSVSRKEFQLAMDCVAAVRDAVKDNALLLIEGHGRFDVPTAIRIGKELENYGIHWFEEPLPPNDFEGLVQVRKCIGVAVAAGERICNRYQFKTFLNMGCADYVQPDVTHVGGIGELRKIATLAESYHLPICPHNPSGPVANAATLQVAATCPNLYLLETMASDVPIRNIVARETLRLENGYMIIPDAPGLGVDIDEEEIVKHPYQPHPIRHFSGNLTDIRPVEESIYYSVNRSKVGEA
jgi:galactonate dehydratase